MVNSKVNTCESWVVRRMDTLLAFMVSSREQGVESEE